MFLKSQATPALTPPQVIYSDPKHDFTIFSTLPLADIAFQDWESLDPTTQHDPRHFEVRLMLSGQSFLKEKVPELRFLVSLEFKHVTLQFVL